MFRVKRNDKVAVISGKDRDAQGMVLDINPTKGLVKVSGVSIVTRHFKGRAQGQASGIKKEESFIDLSNVMPICGDCNKPCRVNFVLQEDGRKVRVCNRCKKSF